MIPLFLAIGATAAGCVSYVLYMVKNTKRKTKPQTSEPIREKPTLKLEDYQIA